MNLNTELVKTLANSGCLLAVKPFDSEHIQIRIDFNSIVNSLQVSSVNELRSHSRTIFNGITATLQKYYDPVTLVSWNKNVAVYKIPYNNLNVSTKNLLYITSHQQVEELKYYSKCLNKTNVIKDFDLILHINKFDIDIDKVRKYFLTFPNKRKHLIFTDKNYGYKLGPHEAISDFYSHIAGYDNVIHTHPDVFIVNENRLLSTLNNTKNYGITVGISNVQPGNINKNIEPQFGTDIFFIRPKLIDKNIFQDYSKEEYRTSICEEFLRDIVLKNKVSYTFVKKYDNDWYLPRRPNLWGYYHEHDLKLLNV